MERTKEVAVLFGTGSIGQAIIRRIGVEKHIVLADLSLEHAEQTAKLLENAGFECSTIKADLGSKEDILAVVAEALKWGEVKLQKIPFRGESFYRKDSPFFVCD